MRPAVVIPRIGENGFASSGCELTGNSHPHDGPYVHVAGKNYSKQGIEEAARLLDLLTSKDAQTKFEKVVHDLIEAKETIKNRAVEASAMKRELDAANAELARVEAQRDKLVETVAKTKTSAAIVSAHVAKILNGED